jgi:hypothetical protein
MAFTLPSEQRLLRFLILGCEGGTYYATEQQLRDQNATCVLELIKNGQGEMVINKVNFKTISPKTKTNKKHTDLEMIIKFPQLYSILFIVPITNAAAIKELAWRQFSYISLWQFCQNTPKEQNTLFFFSFFFLLLMNWMHFVSLFLY